MKSPRGFTSDIVILAFVLLAIGGYYYVHGGFHPSLATPTAPPITYELRTVTDVESTTTLPYITKYPNVAVMNEVNRQIDAIAGNSSCVVGATDAELRDDLLNRPYPPPLTKPEVDRMNRKEVVEALNWYSEEGVTDVYAQNGIFSFEYYFNENCGGPHENFSSTGVIFDMRTGKNIGSKDMFSNFPRDKNAILNILSDAYLAEDKKLSTDSETGEYDTTCADAVDYPEAFDYPAFYISTTSQLIMTPDFAYAVHACANDTPVSIAKLRPYLPADSPLLRLVK